jgi:hypothetical protein
MYEAHGLTGLASTAAPGELGKKPEFINSAVQFDDITAAAVRAFYVLLDFRIIRMGLFKRDATVITSVFAYFHLVLL